MGKSSIPGMKEARYGRPHQTVSGSGSTGSEPLRATSAGVRQLNHILRTESDPQHIPKQHLSYFTKGIPWLPKSETIRPLSRVRDTKHAKSWPSLG